MTKEIKLLSIFILFILSCDPPSTLENQLTIPPELSEEKTLTSISQEVRFRPLMGDGSLLPYDADKIDFTSDLILIADLTLSKTLFAFEKETGRAIEIPIKKGEGPTEVREVNDFWVDEDVIYILDGIGRKIISIRYSGGTFEMDEPVFLEIPLRRFAKTRTGFVGLTGGGLENALAFLDSKGKIISSHFPSSISFLMSPLNPFHKVFGQDENLILFHSSFEPTLFRVDGGQPEEFSTFMFEGIPVKKPEKTDYRMDLDGFNSFRASLKTQPSFFTIFEYTDDQFILLYFLNEIPRMALNERDLGHSFRLENLKNDLSFDQPFPKVTGVTSSGFTAMVNADQINQEDPAFENSILKKAIQENPEARIFLLEFKLKIY